jgi:hypothetical protein
MENETQVGRQMTYGEKAVGLTFNPSGDEKVHIIKTAYANIIDNLDSIRTVIIGDNSVTENKELARLLSIAITEAQTAQMWAVKAITWK